MPASAIAICRLDSLTLDRSTARHIWLGRAAQAIFLEAIARVDPACAAALHAGDGPRPYSVGALLQWPAAAADPWRVHLRFSALEDELAALLPEALARLPATLLLDQLEASVESIAADRVTDRDADRATYQDILNRRMLDPEPPDARVGLRLLTPATFHTGGRNQPLPLPGLVFGNLVDRWNTFSPLTLNVEARRYAEECLAITRFRMESRLVEVAGGKQIGALGTITFRSLRPDPYWLRVIGALADFAFYAGIGAKTAMGLGQARRMDGDGGALHRGTGRDAAQGRRAPGSDQTERDADERAGGEN